MLSSMGKISLEMQFILQCYKCNIILFMVGMYNIQFMVGILYYPTHGVEDSKAIIGVAPWFVLAEINYLKFSKKVQQWKALQ